MFGVNVFCFDIDLRNALQRAENRSYKFQRAKNRSYREEGVLQIQNIDLKSKDKIITMEMVKYIIESRKDRIRYCYERQLITSPNISGQIKVSWTISSQGQPISPKIEQSTIKNAKIEGCVARVIKRLIFPRPNSSMNIPVSVVFDFKSKDKNLKRQDFYTIKKNRKL